MSTMRRLTPDLLAAAGAPVALGGEKASSAASAAADHEAVLRAQHERAFEEARERGFAQGMREAERAIAKSIAEGEAPLRRSYEAGQVALDDERRQVQELAQSLQASVELYARDAETMAVEVAYAALVRLLGDKAADRTLIPELCRAVVREYGHPPATLRVSESDFALLDTKELDIPVESDRRLRPGQCVIDTARGQFESGLDVRLEALTQALLSVVAEHRSPA